MVHGLWVIGHGSWCSKVVNVLIAAPKSIVLKGLGVLIRSDGQLMNSGQKAQGSDTTDAEKRGEAG